jgi:hypothetical protein
MGCNVGVEYKNKAYPEWIGFILGQPVCIGSVLPTPQFPHRSIRPIGFYPPNPCHIVQRRKWHQGCPSPQAWEIHGFIYLLFSDRWNHRPPIFLNKINPLT